MQHTSVKKIVSMILALSIGISLVGCSSSTSSVAQVEQRNIESGNDRVNDTKEENTAPIEEEKDTLKNEELVEDNTKNTEKTEINETVEETMENEEIAEVKDAIEDTNKSVVAEELEKSVKDTDEDTETKGMEENVEEKTADSDTTDLEETEVKANEEQGETVRKDVGQEQLNNVQKNSIAWLNYLAFLSQEINSSKYSRMYLEEAYASLIRNTNPENVNELTESHLASMLDSIEKYRMLTVKRDRLMYIYEQNKAKALKEAVPNPIGLLSAVTSFDIQRLAASAIYMAVDSYANYEAYSNEIAQEYLQDGWVLDDEEAENMHESRKRAFMFMIDIVRQDHLPGELALNEKAVEDFVNAKNNDNNYQRIQFFESEEETYSAFGEYWLTLATCYYEQGEYEKCLEAFEKYRDLGSSIFRKDYYLAKTLPNVIIAGRNLYSNNEYIPFACEMLDLLKENTENSDWSLRYFAAQMYLDLYKKTSDKVFLDEAYALVINNVNNLLPKQKKANSTYISNLKEIDTKDISSSSTKKKSKDEIEKIKAENKKIKKYNKEMEEARKTELPSIYGPLELNCELLFALAEERECSQKEKSTIDGIMKGLFITDAMNEKFSFSYKATVPDATFDAGTLVMPVTCLSDRSVIRVTVVSNEEVSVYEDWIIKKVDRPEGTKNAGDFMAIYTSKQASKQKWSDGATIRVEIFEREYDNGMPYVLNFKVSKYEKRRLLPDKVEFEQVK